MNKQFKCYGHVDLLRSSFIFFSPMIVSIGLFFVIGGIDAISTGVTAGAMLIPILFFPLCFVGNKWCSVEKPINEHSNEEINSDLNIGRIKAYQEKEYNEANKEAEEIRKLYK